MTNDIFCVGLTRTELQTLGVLLPITFRIIPVSSEALDHAAVVRVIDQARCIIHRPGFQAMLAEIEAGRVAVCITKDLSRLGRNSSLTGLYINFTFPKYNVRYIAINDHFDTIDPNSTDSDIAGIKNWFNEFFAKDTSRKIRAVQKAKGERGVPLTTNVPFGYRKDPEDKTK